MKRLLQTLTLTLLTIALVNCGGSSGGGDQAGPLNEVGAATDSTSIEFDDLSGEPIRWTKEENIMYIQSSDNPNCIYTLDEHSDSHVSANRYFELQALINSSEVYKGSQASVNSNSIYLNIKYDDGTTRSFNLTSSLAATSEDTLSRGDEIIDFYDQLATDIQSYNIRSCPGKGSK